MIFLKYDHMNGKLYFLESFVVTVTWMNLFGKVWLSERFSVCAIQSDGVFFIRFSCIFSVAFPD